jgi:uncharacterized OB-fold protein
MVMVARGGRWIVRTVVCRRCGSRVSDQFSFCPKCLTKFGEKDAVSETSEMGLVEWLVTPLDSKRRAFTPEKGAAPSPLDKEKQRCFNCGAGILPEDKFCNSCGQPLSINVVHVLNSTFKILKNYPVFFLPILFYTIASVSLSAWVYTGVQSQLTSSVSDPAQLMTNVLRLIRQTLLPFLFALLLYPVIYGIYPTMVREALTDAKVDLSKAFRVAIAKYPSLLAANTLITVEVFLLALLLLVPGLIAALWYFYTSPAIILENHGARDGMSASKAFGRTRKSDTFIMLLIVWIPFFIIGFASYPLGAASSIGLAVHYVIQGISELIIGVLTSVMASATYLTYAMPKTGARRQRH